MNIEIVSKKMLNHFFLNLIIILIQKKNRMVQSWNIFLGIPYCALHRIDYIDWFYRNDQLFFY